MNISPDSCCSLNSGKPVSPARGGMPTAPQAALIPLKRNVDFIKFNFKVYIHYYKAG
jgi:hypothetical protein